MAGPLVRIPPVETDLSAALDGDDELVPAQVNDDPAAGHQHYGRYINHLPSLTPNTLAVNAARAIRADLNKRLARRDANEP